MEPTVVPDTARPRTGYWYIEATGDIQGGFTLLIFSVDEFL